MSQLYTATLVLLATCISQSIQKTTFGQEETTESSEVSDVEFLENAILEMNQGLLSSDETTRLETLENILPNEARLTALFGEENGSKLWQSYSPVLEKMKKSNIRAKEEMQLAGAVKHIALFDIRAENKEETGMWDSVLKIIPDDIPIYHAVVEHENTTRGSSCYLIINKQMVFIKGLHRVPGFLENPDD